MVEEQKWMMLYRFEFSLFPDFVPFAFTGLGFMNKLFDNKNIVVDIYEQGFLPGIIASLSVLLVEKEH